MKKQVSLLILLILMAKAAAAEPLGIEFELLVVEFNDGVPVRVETQHKSKISRGNFEAHSRKGNAQYRGVPWNMTLLIEDSGEARVVFWIDDQGYRFDDEKVLLLDERWDPGNFQAQSLELYEFDDEAKLILNLMPTPMPPPMEATPLSQSTFGLNFLCLKNSAVLVDESHYLGSFTGFGEYLIVGAPGLAKLSLSFNQIRDWQPIGTFTEGVIEVDLGRGRSMTILGVKYGPGGLDRGGPFTVYGSIEPSEISVSQAREMVEMQLVGSGASAERIKAIMDANQANPYGGIGRGTIGSSEQWSEQLVRTAGMFGKELSECSSGSIR